MVVAVTQNEEKIDFFRCGENFVQGLGKGDLGISTGLWRQMKVVLCLLSLFTSNRRFFSQKCEKMLKNALEVTKNMARLRGLEYIL